MIVHFTILEIFNYGPKITHFGSFTNKHTH
jgi:hypothetical protein